MSLNSTKIKGNTKFNLNLSYVIFFTFTMLFASLHSFAQLNSADSPPEEVLHTLSIKYPGVEASNWSWDSKYVEYVGYFMKDGKTNKVHINTYGKWVKTITYLEKQDLPEEIISDFEKKLNANTIVSEVFQEKSKVWGKQFKIRFIYKTEEKANYENEYTFSEDKQLLEVRKYKKHHIPHVVVKKFDATYLNASNEKWTFNNELFAFEVNFKLEKEKKTAFFAPNGKWMWSEKEASKKEVPDEIISNIENTEYKNWKVDDVTELSSNQINKCYKVKFKNQKQKQYLIFSTDGDLLNKSDLL